MKYTLSEAASATGRNKATIQGSIKGGKISAAKGESESYEIDPFSVIGFSTSLSGRYDV